MSTGVPKRILPLIVVSQFAGTSLWFAGNAILPDLQATFNLGIDAVGPVTSAVQLGFISGTLIFALLAVADRFSPSAVFFISSLLAATANLCITWIPKDFYALMTCRFITGFFLAGIYPVGMKIASDWYEKGLGRALGYLVGALVLGTAFPHLLKSFSWQLSWQKIILFTSLFASAGGLLIFLFVKDGPFRKKAQAFHPRNIVHIFRSKDFRAAAIGYFGHMWELYTFWAFVPALLMLYGNVKDEAINIPFWSFLVIGIGFVSCIAGGYFSRKKGSAGVAFVALLISGTCCVFSFLLLKMSSPFFLVFMLIWGMAVVADSPQFSALVAETAPPAVKGSALTFVTSIGFAITILSVQVMNYFFSASMSSAGIFILLAPGPLAGLWFMYRAFIKK